MLVVKLSNHSANHAVPISKEFWILSYLVNLILFFILFFTLLILPPLRLMSIMVSMGLYNKLRVRETVNCIFMLEKEMVLVLLFAHILLH